MANHAIIGTLIRETSEKQFNALSCRGADSTRSVDLSNMSIRKATVPKDPAASYKGGDTYVLYNCTGWQKCHQ